MATPQIDALNGLPRTAPAEEQVLVNGVWTSLPDAALRATIPTATSLADIGTKIKEGVTSAVTRFGDFINGGMTKVTASGAPISVPGGSSQISAAQANAAQGIQGATDNEHLVSLTSAVNPSEVVDFLVMPEIVENRSVEYEAVAPAQFPGAFQKYKGTASVQWSVNAKLVSRTTAEATDNLKKLNLLRGWTMPYFGQKSEIGKRGAPPPTLKFKGFRKLGTIGEVPVVITSLNWNWPQDVDYIPAMPYGSTEATIPFPTVIQIAINIVESFSTNQFNNFDREAYTRGDMAAAYGGSSSGATVSAPSDLGIQNHVNLRSGEEEAQALGNEGRHGALTVRDTFVNYSNEGRFKAEVLGGYSNEGRFKPPSASELKEAVKPIVSGLGGSFGGGGASGWF